MYMARYGATDEELDARIPLSIAQWHPDNGGIFIRTRGSGVKLADAIRRRLQPEMPGASYLTITPFNEIIGMQTQSWEPRP